MLEKTDIPISLTALRALLGPVVLLLAIYYPSPIGFGLCLVLAFISDIFDGIIARKLNIATPNLRRMDSIADSIFYLSAVLAAWRLYPSVFTDNATTLWILVSLELSRYILDLIKFKREASYHMWSSKLWGIMLFIGFMALLAFGETGWPIKLAIYIGIIADLEGLAISLVIPEWKSDVPSIVHAFRLRR